MNAVRSRYRRSLLAARRALGGAPWDDAIAPVDERDATMRGLANLSPQQPAALVLVNLRVFSSDDAKRFLGIKPSTVRRHTSRAHKALKGTMQDV